MTACTLTKKPAQRRPRRAHRGLVPAVPPYLDPLEQFVSPERVARIDHVLAHRLASLTVVCEDVFDPHNVAACARTCEALGLQDLHWVLNKNALRLSSTVAKAADQWLTFHHHDSTEAGVAALKAQGYELWVSDLQADCALADLPMGPKVAVVIGNAKFGISERMRQLADRRYIVPMHGMVQSFNLSVALALTLADLVPRRRRELARLGQTGDLPAAALAELRAKWLEFGVDRADIVRRALAAEATRDGTP